MFVSGSTKEQIFDIALKLVAERGFDTVSIRDIANEVGIAVSSIYNHFESKDDILDSFYDYYLIYSEGIYKSEEEIKAIIETGTLEEIVTLVTQNTFVEYEEEVGRRMMLITKVIYARMFNHARAAGIFLEHLSKGYENVKFILSYCVEAGRLRPFDINGYNKAIIAMYTHLGIIGFTNPDYKPEVLDEEYEAAEWIMNVFKEYSVK